MSKILDEKFYKYYELEEGINQSLELIEKQTGARFIIIPRVDAKEIFKFGEESAEIYYKDIYKEYFGWDDETVYYRGKYFGLDLRTGKYLDAVIKNTGFVDRESDYDREEFITKETINVWANISGDVTIGKVKNGLWCAEWVESSIDDYSIVKFYFNKKPNAHILQTLNLVDEIMYVGRFYVFKPEFKCLECGRKFHWLDIKGDIFDKYYAKEDRLCGDD